MSKQPNFHQHIEQAIQNVLSKVKTPERGEFPATSDGLKPSSVRPAIRREMNPTGPLTQTETSSQEASAQDLADAVVQETDTRPNETTQAMASEHQEDPVYFEAEDLYTPLQKEDLAPEPDEPPLQQDTYVPPYNLFEEFVETELNILLSRYLDLCRCSQCRADIVALALHQLPAYYVTGTRGTLTAKSVIWTRYMQQVMDAVTKAIHIVYKRPRPTCGKIRQMLWLRPELEEVAVAQAPDAEGEFFGAIYQDDVEIKFSDEVAELIQALELAPGEDKSELLPVFSPVVQNAYKQYALTEEPAEEQLTPKQPEELQLLDID